MTERLDPITIEVVRNKLDGIANEMQSTLLRSSFSPIVKEGLDASASLFTIDGETLSQALAVPIHLATLIPVVRALLDAYPLLSEPTGALRGEVSFARMGHNHWVLERITASLRRVGSREQQMRTRVTNIVAAYSKHTSNTFARALSFSLSVATGDVTDAR